MKLLIGLCFLLLGGIEMQAQTEEQVENESILLMPDEMPLFPGGDTALYIFLAENIQYPADAVDNCIEGKVYFSFWVDKEGKVQDVKIVKGVYPSLDKETLRVASIMPDWEPGKLKGEPVDVMNTVPVYFKLKRKCKPKRNKE